MNFVDALKLCDAGLGEWKSKPHNARWWKRIDGTPIPNDLLVCIARQFMESADKLAAARAADRAEQAPARGPVVKVSKLRELVTEMVNRSGVEMTDWIDAIYALCDRAAEEKGT